MSFVPIIMGSKRDRSHAQVIQDSLAGFGIPSEIRIASAHKAVPYLLQILQQYESDGRPKVYVTVAGRSNALSGVVDSNTTAPVIACPPYSDRFGGADLYSSMRMPSGVAPAVLLEPEAAALLAAKILGLQEPVLAERVAAYHAGLREGIQADDAELTGSTGEP